MEGHLGGRGCGLTLWTRMSRTEQKGWGLETKASARELKGGGHGMRDNVTVPSWGPLQQGGGQDCCLHDPR